MMSFPAPALSKKSTVLAGGKRERGGCAASPEDGSGAEGGGSDSGKDAVCDLVVRVT